MLVTLISDAWLTTDRRPEIWLQEIVSDAASVASTAGFEGYVGLVEVQALVEYSKEIGRVLMPNVHLCAWTSDPAFDVRAAEKRMIESGLLVSQLHAKTAHISSYANSASTNLLAYAFKPPVVGKRFAASRHSASGLIMEDCKLTPGLAARLLETLSSAYLDELFIGGGEGDGAVPAFKAWLDDFDKSQSQLGHVDVAAHAWEMARKTSKTSVYPPGINIARDVQSSRNDGFQISIAKFFAEKRFKINKYEHNLTF